MELPITTALASSISIWLLVLSWAVIKQRRVAGKSLGDGGDVPLLRKMRAQANLAEYAPLFVIMIGLAEYQSDRSLVIGSMAILFMLGRLAHGYALAFSVNDPMGRFVGVALTFIAFGAVILHNILLFIL
ncbi:MAG: MAPEG family protein [Rhizobiaceae bacterium]|nr:MAPEG family protein [Rhizobiaceae bacterium]